MRGLLIGVANYSCGTSRVAGHFTTVAATLILQLCSQLKCKLIANKLARTSSKTAK